MRGSECEVVERTGTMAGCCNIITAHWRNVTDFQNVQGSRLASRRPPPPSTEKWFWWNADVNINTKFSISPPSCQDPLQLMKGHSVGCPANLYKVVNKNINCFHSGYLHSSFTHSKCLGIMTTDWSCAFRNCDHNFKTPGPSLLVSTNREASDESGAGGKMHKNMKAEFKESNILLTCWKTIFAFSLFKTRVYKTSFYYLCLLTLWTLWLYIL